MATSSDAQDALYAAVVTVAKAAAERPGTAGASMLRDAAIAFRAAVGGAQPGSVIVESK